MIIKGETFECFTMVFPLISWLLSCLLNPLTWGVTKRELWIIDIQYSIESYATIWKFQIINSWDDRLLHQDIMEPLTALISGFFFSHLTKQNQSHRSMCWSWLVISEQSIHNILRKSNLDVLEATKTWSGPNTFFLSYSWFGCHQNGGKMSLKVYTWLSTQVNVQSLPNKSFGVWSVMITSSSW